MSSPRLLVVWRETWQARYAQTCQASGFTESLRRGLVPLLQAGLRLLAGLLGGGGAVDHARAQAPQLIFQIWLAARENLVGVADGGLAGSAPAQEFIGNGVLQRNLVIGKREEARQRVAVQLGKFGGGHPLEEFPGLFGMLSLGVHAQGDVGVVADVAGVAGLAHARPEDTHL